MKVGDILYKIDGKLVVNMPHREIMGVLLSCKTLIFEKSRAGQSSSNGPSHQRVEEQEQVRASMKTVSQPSTDVPLEHTLHHNNNELPSVTPQSSHVDCDLSPSTNKAELSVECNVLSSIFSPRHLTNQQMSMNNNSYMSEYIYEIEHDGEDCPDLVAIPDGSRTDTSNGNSMGFITDDDGVDDDHAEYCSVIQQDFRPKEENASCLLGSPAFSYSVTTNNSDSLDPMSPLGANIQMSVSVATSLKEQDDYSSMVSSARQKYHDSQVLKLKQKYASYLSPDEDGESESRGMSMSRNGNTSRSKNMEPLASMETCFVPNSSFKISPIQAQQNLGWESNGHTTPLAALDGLSHTPLSRKTMYHDIPISMLDYKYVRECNSKDELEKIIHTLKMKSPPEFPSLLRMAECRFSELKQSMTNNLDRIDIRTEGGIPRIIHVDTKKDDVGHLTCCDDLFSEYSSLPQSTKGNFASAEDMNEIVIAHAELKGHLEEILQERDAMQSSMSSQIKSLENMLESLKVEMEKQSNESSEKIYSLQQSKDIAEREMQVLRESCISSSKSVEEVTKELQAKESVIGKLSAELYKEQESKRLAMEKAESNSIRLQSQVDRLTNQLRMQVKKTEAIKTIVELQLRAEYEGKIRRDSELLEELGRKLKSAKEDVAVLFNENQFMAKEFAKVGMVRLHRKVYARVLFLLF